MLHVVPSARAARQITTFKLSDGGVVFFLNHFFFSSSMASSIAIASAWRPLLTIRSVMSVRLSMRLVRLVELMGCPERESADRTMGWSTFAAEPAVWVSGSEEARVTRTRMSQPQALLLLLMAGALSVHASRVQLHAMRSIR